MLERLDRLYVRITEILVILALAAMVGIGFVSTCLRGVPGHGGLYWSEEIIRYACIWMVFLASGLTVRHGVHFHVDLLVNRFPERMRTAFALFSGLLMLWFEAVLIWFGGVVAISNLQQQSTSLEFPMGYVYAAIPVGGLLMLFETLRYMWRTLHGAGSVDQAERILVD